MAKQITGLIDKIKLYDDENGYGIVDIVPDDRNLVANPFNGTITVVGQMPAFREGESVRFTGDWTNHRVYGNQFKASQSVLRIPRTRAEIEVFLGSAAVKGIDPEAANRIVNHFGGATLEILDETPERVYTVDGLGKVEVEYFLEHWRKDQEPRHTQIYLQSELGLDARTARRIYKEHGSDTRKIAKYKPYDLAVDGLITFEKADAIARKLGLREDHPNRLKAGIFQTIHEFTRRGHTFAPREGLLEEAAKLLETDDNGALADALKALLDDEKLREDRLEYGNHDRDSKSIRAIYLEQFWQAENDVAEKLRILLIHDSGLKQSFRSEYGARKLEHLSGILDLSLDQEQMNAVRMAMTSKISILTGGPGTGKTVTLKLLASALRDNGHKFQLAAPTGLAARRLAEATDSDASTIHRLLQYDLKAGGFVRNEKNPLQTELVVVDEASMLDLELFYSLLKALPETAHLLLVGDADQLPSVGAGNVLRDVINCDSFKVTCLDKVYRQDEDSRIAYFVRDIKMGKYPEINKNIDDRFFLSKNMDPEIISREIVDLVTKRIPEKFGLDPIQDIQVISPVSRGPIGVNRLNQSLQQALNAESGQQIFMQAARRFRVGDKVMQTKNDYEKGIYNGEIGFIRDIRKDRVLAVEFPGMKSEEVDFDNSDGFLDLPPDANYIIYQAGEVDSLTLAYCVTVHKSQGSEFPAVVMPVHDSQGWMLRRNLFYTAITRAQKLVVLVGNKQALMRAIENDSNDERHSGLLQRLRDMKGNRLV